MFDKKEKNPDKVENEKTVETTETETAAEEIKEEMSCSSSDAPVEQEAPIEASETVSAAESEEPQAAPKEAEMPTPSLRQRQKLTLSHIKAHIRSTADILSIRKADLSIPLSHSRRLRAQTTLSRIRSLIPSKDITDSIRIKRRNRRTCLMHLLRCRRRICRIRRGHSRMHRICRILKTAHRCRLCIPQCRLSSL